MASKREQVLSALFDRLRSVGGAIVKRNEVLAQTVPARLGADVDRYSFIAVDFHHLLLAGLPAHSAVR